MKKYKISSEEFNKVSYQKLANSPGANSTFGESKLTGEELKARMDKPFELFMAKFNLLISLIVGAPDGDSLIKNIPTGINETHTLYDLIRDITSDGAEFASYLSVGEQTLLEKLREIADTLKEQAESTKELGEALGGYVKRSEKSGGTFAYVTDGGEDDVLQVARGADPLSIPLRYTNGRVRVGSPVEDEDAVTLAHLRAGYLGNAGVQVLDGSLTISGDIFVGGEAKAKQLESIEVADACIIANADGVPLAELSGYVIRVTAEQAYAIVYDPIAQCVKIGLGVYDGEAKVFTFNEGEAQPLATRGELADGELPVWDGEKNTLKGSGLKVKDVTEQHGKFSQKNEVAGALEGSAFGEAVALKDVSKVEHDLGVRVSSKNLFSLQSSTATPRGITFEPQNDGGIHVYGTNDGSGRSYCNMYITIPKGIYNLSGIPTGGSKSTYYFEFFGTESNKTYGYDFGNGVVAELKEPERCNLQLSVAVGMTVDFTVYPMLVKGTLKPAIYTPYISDISALKLRVQGKNLIDRNKITADGGELAFDGNAQTFVSVKGGGNLYANLGNYKEFIGKKLTVSYTFVGHQSTAGRKGFNTYIQTDTDTVIAQKADLNSDGKTFEMSAVIPEDDTATNLIIRQYIGYTTTAAGDYVTISDFQAELDEKTEYEPYVEPIEYSVNADGTVEGVKSLYPSTTLTTDTVGALIEVDYNIDINKAFEEIRKVILSLGGTL